MLKAGRPSNKELRKRKVQRETPKCLNGNPELTYCETMFIAEVINLALYDYVRPMPKKIGRMTNKEYLEVLQEWEDNRRSAIDFFENSDLFAATQLNLKDLLRNYTNPQIRIPKPADYYRVHQE